METTGSIKHGAKYPEMKHETQRQIDKKVKKNLNCTRVQINKKGPTRTKLMSKDRKYILGVFI